MSEAIRSDEIMWKPAGPPTKRFNFLNFLVEYMRVEYSISP